MTDRATAFGNRQEAFVRQMTVQMRRLAQTTPEWVQAPTRPTQHIAAQAVRVMHEPGNRGHLPPRRGGLRG